MGCDGKENVSGGSFEDVTGRGVGRRGESARASERGGVEKQSWITGAGAVSGASEACEICGRRVGSRKRRRTKGRTDRVEEADYGTLFFF